jgi:hypothetical protein
VSHANARLTVHGRAELVRRGIEQRRPGADVVAGPLAHPRAGWRAPSTVQAVLRYQGLHRLACLDRPTGQLIRRFKRARPGELVPAR